MAAEDYTQDIRISNEILERLVEAYRRIRNTSRFILGNLYDFDCINHMVPYGDMEEMDRWVLHKLQEVIRRVREAYDQYQFHVVFYTLYNFCTVDLSALYLDVLKDRLYTSKAQSEKRRSAQSAMYVILDAMTRLLAPILTFTAEEIWSSLPSHGGKEISVHLTRLPSPRPELTDMELAERWKTMVALKGEVSKAVEIARQKKVIGHTLDARVDISPPEKLREFLAARLEDMRALLIVSQVNIVPKDSLTDPYVSGEFEGLTIGVTKAPGEKCNRCWIFSESVGADEKNPAICTRCCGNLE